MHFKNGRSVGNGAHAWMGTTSRVMVANRLKTSSYHMTASVPEIMDTSVMQQQMIYYHILVLSVQNFTQLGGGADFLCPFIWSCVSGLMQFHE
jgi:hypothetical protein